MKLREREGQGVDPGRSLKGQTEQADDEAKWQRIIGELGLGDRDTIDYDSFEKIMLKGTINPQD